MQVSRRQFLLSSLTAAAAGTSAASAPSSQKRPNILWIMTDEQRVDSLGCYGSPWARTPTLDKLAREGVLFETAITPSPVCAPARAALVTGRYPHEVGVLHNIPPSEYPEMPHLTDAFHAAGYRSASIGKRHYSASNPAFQHESHFEVSPAVDWFDYKPPYKGEDHGMLRYPPNPHAWILGGRFPAPIEEKPEARVVREAQAWLGEHPVEEPFFLRLSFNAPHTPVVPPEPYDTIIPVEAITYPPEAESAPEHEPAWIAQQLRPSSDAKVLTREQIQQARQHYYGEVAFLDGQIKTILEWMQDRRMLDDTIIVFTSDHGTHIGDFSLVQKRSFYEPVVRVPYFFWYPAAIRSGITLRTPVETRTLLPTLINLAGLDLPEDFHAANLAPQLRSGEEPPERPVFSEISLRDFGGPDNSRIVMLRHGPWKLTLDLSATPYDGALIHLDRDPCERENLFHQPEAAEILARLTARIETHLN